MGCVKSKFLRSFHDDKGRDQDKATIVDEDDIQHPGNSNIVIEGLDEADCQKSSVLADLVGSIHKNSTFDLDNKCVHVVTADVATIESIYDGVRDGPILGYGITGVVRKAVHRETGAEYAIKTLSLNRIETAAGLEQLKEELVILMQLDHPNIVKLEEVYESENEIFLVQELLSGGDLFDRLDDQPMEHYSEGQCARLVKQMLSAVRYIHSKGIIHRDLKLENFLFDDAGPDGELKMIDFGLSKHFTAGSKHHEPVGTRYTVAPEVLRKHYDEKADVWAIGVITFLLLSGEAPFGGCYEDDESPAEIKDKILNARYSFEPEEYWSHVSDEAKDFIAHILVADPAKRPTAYECQSHPWLRDWQKDEQLSEPLGENVQQALRKFRGFSDIRKLLCEVIGFTLLPNQIKELRKEFEKLDVEQRGEISLPSLKRVLLENAGKSGSFHNILTEEEVEDIFNSLRLHKTDTTIHWHHFLAAGLSECPVDERNHRLAFERLDHEQKGYITFDDVVKLIGPESLKRRVPSLEKQWGDSIDINRAGSKVYYKDFLKLMSPLVEVDEEE